MLLPLRLCPVQVRPLAAKPLAKRRAVDATLCDEVAISARQRELNRVAPLCYVTCLPLHLGEQTLATLLQRNDLRRLRRGAQREYCTRDHLWEGDRGAQGMQVLGEQIEGLGDEPLLVDPLAAFRSGNLQHGRPIERLVARRAPWRLRELGELERLHKQRCNRYVDLKLRRYLIEDPRTLEAQRCVAY